MQKSKSKLINSLKQLQSSKVYGMKHLLLSEYVSIKIFLLIKNIETVDLDLYTKVAKIFADLLFKIFRFQSNFFTGLCQQRPFLQYIFQN